MKKIPAESWLHYFNRLILNLIRDDNDRKYWSGIFAMSGAASLAVASIEASSVAFYSGICFCLYGLKLNRRR